MSPCHSVSNPTPARSCPSPQGARLPAGEPGRAAALPRLWRALRSRQRQLQLQARSVRARAPPPSLPCAPALHPAADNLARMYSNCIPKPAPLPSAPSRCSTRVASDAFDELRQQNSVEATLLPAIGGLTTGVLALGYPEILYQARAWVVQRKEFAWMECGAETAAQRCQHCGRAGAVVTAACAEEGGICIALHSAPHEGESGGRAALSLC